MSNEYREKTVCEQSLCVDFCKGRKSQAFAFTANEYIHAVIVTDIGLGELLFLRLIRLLIELAPSRDTARVTILCAPQETGWSLGKTLPRS